MRLKYQLFFTLLLAGALLVTVMFLVSSYTFSRGFLGYINSADNDRVQALATELEKQYAQDLSWENTVSNGDIWDDAIKAVDEQFARTQRFRNPERQSLTKKPKNNKDKRRAEKKHTKHPPPTPPFERAKQRLILADEDKQILIGKLDKKSKPVWQAINHNDKEVGYVALKQLKQVENQFDQAFEKQQKRSFALAGVSMVLLSALLAAPLASRIVKPIVGVQQSVAQISQGNYDHQITNNRSDEIGDLTTDINKLGNTLQQNRKARQRMFAEVSHELRTPVAVLRSELEALQDGIRDLDESSIDSLHSETMKLNRIIDDLKTLSLSDTGELSYDMKEINLSELLKNIAAKHTDTDLPITTNIENSLLIHGDQERLGQLFSNLLQNSRRYTDIPGSIDISMTTDQNQTVNIIWSDSAPGVSDSALEKLFDPLFRAEQSRSRSFGGSGLGLSIVRNIVTAHQGTCTAHHSKNGGLSIEITFPHIGIHA